MKRQIRLGVFETNSSSTHTLTICSEKDFDLWVEGVYVLDTWADQLVDRANVNWEDADEWDYQSYNEWCEDGYLEIYTKKFTTPSGDRVVVFGKYGYDG